MSWGINNNFSTSFQ